MSKVLGQLPGSLELIDQALLKAILLTQRNSRGRQGPRLTVQPKLLDSIKQQGISCADTSKSANQASSLLHVQSQLSVSEPIKSAHTNSTASRRERTVLTVLDNSGVTDTNERAMFMAQMSNESGEFTRLTENLNYKPARLLAIFPKKFSSLQDAQTVVRGGQPAIAELIYGNQLNLAFRACVVLRAWCLRRVIVVYSECALD